MAMHVAQSVTWWKMKKDLQESSWYTGLQVYSIGVGSGGARG